jgi:hypothetical protein
MESKIFFTISEFAQLTEKVLQAHVPAVEHILEHYCRLSVQGEDDFLRRLNCFLTTYFVEPKNIHQYGFDSNAKNPPQINVAFWWIYKKMHKKIRDIGHESNPEFQEHLSEDDYKQICKRLGNIDKWTGLFNKSNTGFLSIHLVNEHWKSILIKRKEEYESLHGIKSIKSRIGIKKTEPKTLLDNWRGEESEFYDIIKKHLSAFVTLKNGHLSWNRMRGRNKFIAGFYRTCTEKNRFKRKDFDAPKVRDLLQNTFDVVIGSANPFKAEELSTLGPKYLQPFKNIPEYNSIK